MNSRFSLDFLDSEMKDAAALVAEVEPVSALSVIAHRHGKTVPELFTPSRSFFIGKLRGLVGFKDQMYSFGRLCFECDKMVILLQRLRCIDEPARLMHLAHPFLPSCVEKNPAVLEIHAQLLREEVLWIGNQAILRLVLVNVFRADEARSAKLAELSKRLVYFEAEDIIETIEKSKAWLDCRGFISVWEMLAPSEGLERFYSAIEQGDYFSALKVANLLLEHRE